METHRRGRGHEAPLSGANMSSYDVEGGVASGGAATSRGGVAQGGLSSPSLPAAPSARAGAVHRPATGFSKAGFVSVIMLLSSLTADVRCACEIRAGSAIPLYPSVAKHNSIDTANSLLDHTQPYRLRADLG